MLCPMKMTNPNDQTSMECEPECALRAVSIFQVPVEDNSEQMQNIIAHYCGWMAIGHKNIQLENMQFEQAPSFEPQSFPEDDIDNIEDQLSVLMSEMGNNTVETEIIED